MRYPKMHVGKGVSPLPEFVSKTHLSSRGLGALKAICVPALTSESDEDKLLCPVRSLEEYLGRTNAFRSDSQRRLFISYRRGAGKDLSQQTISVYIKEAILLAYNSSNNVSGQSRVHVKPHSVRHVATSLNALKGFKLDDVLKAGAWASPGTILRFYVQNFSTDRIVLINNTCICFLGPKVKLD